MSAPGTPGPWKVGRDSDYPASFGIIEGPAFPISYVLWATDVTHEMGKQRDRDAYLIAASPALYEALEGVITLVDLAVSCWEDCPYPDVMKTRLARAKLALALARGEQPESRA